MLGTSTPRRVRGVGKSGLRPCLHLQFLTRGRTSALAILCFGFLSIALSTALAAHGGPHIGENNNIGEVKACLIINDLTQCTP